MPRPKTENTFQTSLKLPEAWVEMADEIAAAMSTEGITVTRSDALRAALRRGLTQLHGEKVARKGRRSASR